MVSMCGGCNLYEPWAAVLVGLIAAHCYLAVHVIMLRLKVSFSFVISLKGECFPPIFLSINLILAHEKQMKYFE